MPDKPLSCDEVQTLMAAANALPDVAAHLAECDRCLDAFLDGGLGRSPSVSVPSGFAARAAARIRRDRRRDERRASSWALVAACVLFSLLAWWALTHGVWPLQVSRVLPPPPNPVALAALAGVEVALIFGWLWRLSRA
jgi:ferric-dicitrate binding protein FerR (iron transport regulator)